VPYVLAACVQTPCYARSLQEFGQRFSAASLFPAAPDAVVIDLGMASLARRIVRVVRPASRHQMAGSFRSTVAAGAGRHPGGIAGGSTNGSHRMEETLVVIDLSMADDATILDDARRLYRARPKNGAQRGFVGADAHDALPPRQPLPDATAL
jgi:hypothetical protein